jgi:hypothetical protein
MRGFFSALYNVAVALWVGGLLAMGYLALLNFEWG